MKLEAAGAIVYRGEEVVSTARLDGITRALGTNSSERTARLVPFFGPTVAGEERFVEALDLDLSRALLGGLSYEWVRPFRDGEIVEVEVSIENVFDKGRNRFGIVVATFRDTGGTIVQRQSSTFIENQEG